MSAKPKPFDFDDLRQTLTPTGDAVAPTAAFTADDVEAARAEGVAEGRRLAMQTVAVEEATALSRIGGLLAGQRDFLGRAADDDRMLAHETLSAFLEEFCGELCATREIEIAADLLRRLTENSDDRRAARLLLNPVSHERLQARLEKMLAARGLEDFVCTAADPALVAGEARIEWRGGAVRRGRSEIKTAIKSLFETLNAVHKETQS